MVAPGCPLVRRDLRDRLHEVGLAARGQMQVVWLVRRRRHAQQARIEADDLLHRHVDDVGDQAKVDGAVHGYGVVGYRRIGVDVCQPVLHRILRHDGRSQNDGDVVLRLLRQIVAPVELPEVSVAGALDCALHIARAPVIAGHRQVPVAKLLVVLLDLARVGPGGLLRIEALIYPAIALQAVGTAKGHELPHAALHRNAR